MIEKSQPEALNAMVSPTAIATGAGADAGPRAGLLTSPPPPPQAAKPNVMATTADVINDLRNMEISSWKGQVKRDG